jgi:hypothetical protein
MTLCKVLLSGLKPSDINYSTNDKISEIPLQRQRQYSFNTTPSIHHVENKISPETDYLNLNIKPLAATPTSSVRNNHLFFIEKKDNTN